MQGRKKQKRVKELSEYEKGGKSQDLNTVTPTMRSKGQKEHTRVNMEDGPKELFRVTRRFGVTRRKYGGTVQRT